MFYPKLNFSNFVLPMINLLKIMRYLVDTSVIYRIFEKGESKEKEEALRILRDENIYIPCEVIAEIFYLLRRNLKLSKRETVEEIRKIISFPNVETDKEVPEALLILEREKIDKFTDALSIVKAISKGYGLITNDKAQAETFKKLA